MNITVLKFGGTSVSTENGRKLCISHVKEHILNGKKVVCVVSAMGRNKDPYATDTLLSLIGSDVQLNKKDLDLLLSTGELISAAVFSQDLHHAGIRNTVMTGGQAGIITNDDYNKAKIIDLKPVRLKNELAQHDVVVVTGFQGITETGELTTLGRGGSDTSAAALGVSVGAECVEIFTDVDGVYTADPRIVDEARCISRITYHEVCNLAHLGAKVIHPRAVEMAMNSNIPIRVRSTFTTNEGTLVTNVSEIERQNRIQDNGVISGITQTEGYTRFSLTLEQDIPKTHCEILERLAEQSINLDFIYLSTETMSFIVQENDSETVEKILLSYSTSLHTQHQLAKISLVGANMAGVSGVMEKIVKTLYKNDIPIYQTADSHTTIWVLTDQRYTCSSVQVLHRAFELEKTV